MRVLVAATVAVGVLAASAGRAQVVINEVVTDPQQDWSDSSGGNMVAFDAIPGTGTVNEADEWIELLNKGGAPVDISGWTIDMIDSGGFESADIPEGFSSFHFSAGGNFFALQPGEYVVLGDPTNQMNDTLNLVVRSGATIFDTLNPGFSGAPDGNATSTANEALQRIPNGIDSGVDSADIEKFAATIAARNGLLFASGFESAGFAGWSVVNP